MQILRIGCFFLICVALTVCNDSKKSTDGQADAGRSDNWNDSGNDAGLDSDDQTESMFSPDRVIDIQIELDPMDFETLTHEGRGLASIFSGCAGDLEYTYFEGTVTIDGETIEHVGIRKKGYLGSLSTIRPSLKINFSTFVPGQTYSGMKRMTLNNDKQDPSHTHQVMSYALFRKAGVPAPRCNFARVTVNGEDMGIYSHVESIKKPFLARHFEDNDGNLYEGQIADFTEELVSEFQRKTNEEAILSDSTEPDRSDLQRVVDALKVQDSELVEALEQVIDLDAFMTFWAMEVITGHWDGYTGNRNNFYIYHDPSSDLFYFIPWGMDGAFADDHAFLEDIPSSVYAWGAIAYRLYMYTETQWLYYAKLNSLLADIWNEEELRAEVDRIEALVSPGAAALAESLDFLTSRKTAIQNELEIEGTHWWYPLYSEEPACWPPTDQVSGTFRALWTEQESYTPHDELSLVLTLDGESQSFTFMANSIGPPEEKEGEAENDAKDMAVLRFYATRAEGNPLVVVLVIPRELMKVGEVPFHGMETFGNLIEIVEETQDIERFNYIGNGVIRFDTVATSEGDEVKGSFHGLISR